MIGHIPPIPPIPIPHAVPPSVRLVFKGPIGPIDSSLLGLIDKMATSSNMTGRLWGDWFKDQIFSSEMYRMLLEM